jgi:hypothetical protein
LVQDVKRSFAGAAVLDKLKALIAIAGKVQRGGNYGSGNTQYRFDRLCLLHVLASNE